MEVNSHTCELMSTKSPANTDVTRDKHSALQITLSGPSLIVTIVGLILAIHLLHPSITAMLIALATVQYIVTNDFKAFLSLGPGGTPSTFLGYLKITYLRLFALSDPFSPSSCLSSSETYPSVGFFQSCEAEIWLPYRQGPRPNVAGIAPQRQLDQYGCPKVHQCIRDALQHATKVYPNVLRTGVSCFEKNGIALFGMKCVNRTCNGEICHIHASDKSLHLSLHPTDAKVVLERGWGQRHPLARSGWLRKYVVSAVPPEFVMVYAPKTIEEGKIIARVVEAAAWWVMGEKIELDIGRGWREAEAA
ncbi:MAG: hypothetical protein M1818_006661 [Claussenomyces sp. TS43310]|nr:MAG: hypothetical protein M1818_006906 [Claussenomyces sp. TS43310]KAI9735083.1 MAG: hypothetical protein M1818_006661 [Claussenomyces sp. TS43310]